MKRGSVNEAESMFQFKVDPAPRQRGGRRDFGLPAQQVIFDPALFDVRAMFGAEDALVGGPGSLKYDLLPDLMDSELGPIDASF